MPEQQNSAATPCILQVKDLRVHFPIRKGILQRVVGQVKAVDGVSLEIAKGRTLALVGESGCGKTTLGKALLQLIPPTAGSVKFDGRELTGASRRQRASMQMVFQDPYASLNPKMRVAEILEEGMSALGIGGGRVTRQAQTRCWIKSAWNATPSGAIRTSSRAGNGNASRLRVRWRYHPNC